jgi:hypothetical protein
MRAPWFTRDPFALAPAAILTAILAAAPAHAQGPGPTNRAAAAHYNKGVELYGQGDRKGALDEFRRAYETQPNFRLLVNMAQIQLQIEDWVGAYTSFQRYLADGGAKVNAERRAQVEGELKRLHAHVAILTVTAADHDVEVSLDGKAVGKTPLDKPLVLPAGAHTLLAKKEGRPDVERRADLAGEVTVVLDPGAPPPAVAGVAAPAPAPVPAPVPARAPAQPAPDARKSSHGVPATWISWGITGALAGSTAVTGVLALRASSKYSDKLNESPVTHSELEAAQGKARTLVLVTGALGAATAVSAGISLYLQLSRKPPREAPKEARFEILFGPGSAFARGSF